MLRDRIERRWHEFFLLEYSLAFYEVFPIFSSVFTKVSQIERSNIRHFLSIVSNIRNNCLYLDIGAPYSGSIETMLAPLLR